MSINYKTFTQFLIEAKKNTYASKENTTSVSPVLDGSKQLEYRNDDYVYRDIYFGSSYFAGQEIVEYQNRPIWSMVYAGGIINANDDRIGFIYGFLREALRLVDEQSLYRGPKQYKKGTYMFQNEYEGNVDCFHGKESIYIEEEKVYELRYNGGFLR